MKKLLVALTCAMAVMLCACQASEPTTVVETKTVLDAYAENPYEFRSLTLDAFSTDPNDAPTDAELTEMLHFAMSSANGHGKTPAHFVVIRDAEVQKDILSGVTKFGLPNPASEGTVTVLIFGDAIRSQDYHQAPYTKWYSQGTNALYDTGASAAVLQIAAQAKGYNVHQLLGLNIPYQDENASELKGWDLVSSNYFDARKYLVSKDGNVRFTHVVGSYEKEGDHETIQAMGNLNLCAAYGYRQKS